MEILKTDGSTEKREGKPTLETLQKIVGGYIEIVRLSQKLSMVINEDGIRLGLPTNKEATRHYASVGGRNDIVGNAVLCTNSELN
jgi:hypothetical protein